MLRLSHRCAAQQGHACWRSIRTNLNRNARASSRGAAKNRRAPCRPDYSPVRARWIWTCLEIAQKTPSWIRSNHNWPAGQRKNGKEVGGYCFTENKALNGYFLERGVSSNLNMRTFLRRMTGLCLGFSEKLENLKRAVSLYFAWYIFVRVHSIIKTTPAAPAGLRDWAWTLAELLCASTR